MKEREKFIMEQFKKTQVESQRSMNASKTFISSQQEIVNPLINNQERKANSQSPVASVKQMREQREFASSSNIHSKSRFNRRD